MKIGFSVDAVLIACKEQKGVKDPSKSYYRLSIEENDEAGAIGCTEDVFKEVSSGTAKKYQKYTFLGEINTDYGSITIQHIVPFEKK